MNFAPNMHRFDRLMRLLTGLVIAEAGFFWLAAPARYVAYVLGAFMVATAIVGYCPQYSLLGIRRWAGSDGGGRVLGLASAVAVVAIVGGAGYGSHFATRKMFLAEYGGMNQDYKQVLLHTSRNDRAQARRHYEALVKRYGEFHSKYSSFHPWALRGDAQFDADLKSVAGIIAAARAEVTTGDLQRAHVALEAARPVLQGILKRNGFSLLAVALVDFHDPMEALVEAAARKDAARAVALHAAADASLRGVEAQANDADIQAIRTHLDELLALARSGRNDALPGKGDQLKRSFAKVYLARG